MHGALPRASGEERHPALGETRLFTRVPHPGAGGGLLVDGDTVWTPTLGFIDAEVDRWPVWAYDRLTGREQVDKTFSIERPGPAAMAMRGMARDAQRRLYLVDMNGRVLRTAVPSPGGRKTVEVYATLPTQGSGAAYIPWAGVSMPADITFDGAGNAYIADASFPVVWRVPPGGGEAHLWFVYPQRQGVGFGVLAATLAPGGRDLNFSMCQSSSPRHPLDGGIYRIPIDAPTASQMTEVFRSPGSCPAGLAFGATGRFYASVFLANQVLVLNPDGTEERRFLPEKPTPARRSPTTSPGFSPWTATAGSSWATRRSSARALGDPQGLCRRHPRTPGRAVLAVTSARRAAASRPRPIPA